MIIIKTANGDRFINEAETLQVSHIKDKAQVEVWPSRWGNQQQQPQYFIIENVEAVIYTSKETEWRDNGEESTAHWSQPAGDFWGDSVAVTVYNEMLRIEEAEVEQQKRTHFNCHKIQRNGNACRFLSACRNNNIDTVDQLYKLGRARFERLRNMGPRCADEVAQALKNLYGIGEW